MFSETTCKVLGCLASAIIGIYILRALMQHIKNDNMEGFDNDDISSITKSVEEMIIERKNKLKIDDNNREHYEDMLKHLDTIIGADILIKLTENSKKIAETPDSKESIALMNKLHTMTEFRESINKITTGWLDSQRNFK